MLVLYIDFNYLFYFKGIQYNSDVEFIGKLINVKLLLNQNYS